MKTFIINGMFLCQRMSGIQRYAFEIVKRLDEWANNSTVRFEILVPFKIIYEWRPSNIPIFESNLRNCTINKHYWLNIILPAYAIKRNAIPVNLCNLGPILGTGIICIHDIMYKSNASYFPAKKRIMPLLYYHYLTKHGKKIVTVSKTTKNEIKQYYRVPEDKIVVIGNGWEHITLVSPDKKTLEKYNLIKGEYYIAIGNISPHKNFKWVINEAINNPSEKFVIVGKIVLGLDNKQALFMPKNVTLTGYISDNECKALLQGSKALLFPSFCEGFGIPPLEILAIGGNAIVSKESCMPEIFGNSVAYIDPYKSDYNLNEINLSSDAQAKNDVLSTHRWELSAQKWMNLLESL